jgi:hypothetical protein
MSDSTANDGAFSSRLLSFRALSRNRVSWARFLGYVSQEAATPLDSVAKPWRNAAMKTQTSLLTLALCLAAGAVCFAADAWMGTWKLDEAKSKLDAAGPKNDTVVYDQADGDKVKITVHGTNPDGKFTHDEWTGNFDGKDYPVTGNPNSDTRSYKKVDDRTLDFDVKKDGKVIATGRVVVAAGGKTRTVTTSGTNAKGKKFKSTAVYDKQ